ncbi:MAG: Thiol:disulfide interchange protein DsbD, partial [uncultured bacterium]
MALHVSPTAQLSIAYPKTVWHSDEERGHYQAYVETSRILVRLAHPSSASTLQLHYQGCSQDGFCYPPMEKQFALNAKAGTVTEINATPSSASAAPTFSVLSLLTHQDQMSALLKKQPIAIILGFSVILGLLLAFTPCVLPMIPILTAVIVGQENQRGSKKAFFLSLTYVLGMSLTYAGAGLLAAMLGRSVQVWLQQPAVIIATCLLFLVLALSLFGLYELRLPNGLHNRLANFSNRYTSGTYLGVFMMSVFATLIVSPCVSAPLIGVLIYISQTGDLLLGASTLFSIGIGMGMPLLVIGTSAGSFLPKRGPWMERVKKGLGVLMLLMAMWLGSRVIMLQRPVATAVNTPAFTVVHTMQTLEQQFILARVSHRPILLDFYADWCADCVAMDHHVFGEASVQQALTPFVLLRADISENSEENIQLMKRFHVVAPPAVLFF